jgi:hypothetical protein
MWKKNMVSRESDLEMVAFPLTIPWMTWGSGSCRPSDHAQSGRYCLGFDYKTLNQNWGIDLWLGYDSFNVSIVPLRFMLNIEFLVY